ncbi:hypothetical protein QR680_015721 [Steinernema hermaphroditum]|uniref:Uncharacterized protein n=1 Tax=Steinernema hermaphroditum TaxID=289476 RepID=A0AA39H8R5_9BILA|nr:hypothetical protein QR680_015721 [Steinernema hermaphroditum]
MTHTMGCDSLSAVCISHFGVARGHRCGGDSGGRRSKMMRQARLLPRSTPEASRFSFDFSRAEPTSREGAAPDLIAAKFSRLTGRRAWLRNQASADFSLILTRIRLIDMPKKHRILSSASKG